MTTPINSTYILRIQRLPSVISVGVFLLSLVVTFLMSRFNEVVSVDPGNELANKTVSDLAAPLRKELLEKSVLDYRFPKWQLCLELSYCVHSITMLFVFASIFSVSPTLFLDVVVHSRCLSSRCCHRKERRL